MNITPDDPRLTAYVLGELDQHERAEVQAQVRQSPELQRAVQEIRETAQLLSEEFSRETAPGLTNEQRRTIERAAARQNGRAGSPRRPLLMNRVFLGSSALAACLLIVVSVWLVQTAHLYDSVEGTIGGLPEYPASDGVSYPSVEGTISGVDDVYPSVLHTPGSTAGKVVLGGAVDNVDGTGARAGDRRGGSRLLRKKPEPLADARLKNVQSLGLMTASVAGVGQERAEAGEQMYFGGGLACALENRFNTEAYDHIIENTFKRVTDEPLSTFSIDVDTASYANVRRFLNNGQLPPPGAVRIEEMINYFDYDYPLPDGDVPFSVNVEIADCPWAADHRLARIGLKGMEIVQEERPPANLVFLIDVSGSMRPPNKLPLLREALGLLVAELSEDDQVAMVVYAGASGLVLDSTSCREKDSILRALRALEGGGSTNGGEGIQLAYDIATDNFIEGGINRVILATDGDFNVGITNQGDLISLIEEKAKTGVFLSVLGFGMGNYKDSNLEKLADKGNGNYAYIDTLNEAQKVLVDQMGGTLMTIAKDVKIQIEFNPAEVNAYRLVGYENRMLAKEDFNDDTKDAGEIGAGHTVTAFYEIVPVGVEVDLPPVDPLKYQPKWDVQGDEGGEADEGGASGEMMTVKLRYKPPAGDRSKLIEVPITDDGLLLADASDDFAFAASVASFGMLLRGSEYARDLTYDAVLEMAQASLGEDRNGYRAEFVDLVHKAMGIQP
jgi:Ca-activated chloride channel family protein